MVLKKNSVKKSAKYNLSQEALAWEANIEPMQISRIERGVINTSISQVLNLAKALNIKPGELFDRA